MQDIINNVNPYEPSKEQSAVCDHQRIDTPREVRRWLDGRCILVAILSLLLGTISWISLSLIGEHPFLMASVAEMLAWFVGIGLLTGCIDPRNPWINWLMVYAGTYLINLPFFPPDPLLPVGLIIGLFYSGFGVFAGTMIPSIVAYYFPLRSLSVRRWAGYTVKHASGKEPYWIGVLSKRRTNIDVAWGPEGQLSRLVYADFLSQFSDDMSAGSD